MTSNWNVWGPEDERGALNYITPEISLAAASLVETGEVFSLAQPIHTGMKMPPHRSGVTHLMGRDGGDYAAGARQPGGFQFSEDTIVMPIHTGTHIDALCHCWYDNKLYNGFSSDTVRSGGAKRLGVEKMGPIVTRGVLLDFVTLTGAPLSDGTPITSDMLMDALEAAGVQVQAGDAVLLRTGWQEAQDNIDVADFNSEPGLDLAAARKLAEAGVALIGADNYAVEVMPFQSNTVFPVHQCLMRDFGIPLLEGLVLQPLAEKGRSSFLFVLGTLPIVGGTGSPVAPIVLL